MLAKKNNPHNFFDNLNLYYSDLSLQIPNIWDRRFDATMVELGKAHEVWIDVFGELRKELGSCYEVASRIISLARLFNQNNFHFSNSEFLEYMGGTTSESTLYRKKSKLHKLEVLHWYGGVKNRTHYCLNGEWFKNFINGLFYKLAALKPENVATQTRMLKYE
jgi:hypothetical protein